MSRAPLPEVSELKKRPKAADGQAGPAEPIRRRAMVVGHGGDEAEREADRVADEVVQRIGRGGHQHVDGCCDTGDVARSHTPTANPEVGYEGGVVSDDLSAKIRSARGGGAALESPVRSRMERAFGTDLSGVRIHADDQAAQLSSSVSARAFTTGNDIFFGKGQYRPDTPSGQRVLAHEIAHTRQQGSESVQRWLTGWKGKKKEDVAKKRVNETGGEAPGTMTQAEQDAAGHVGNMSKAGEVMDAVQQGTGSFGNFNDANDFSSNAAQYNLNIRYGSQWGSTDQQNTLAGFGSADAAFGLAVGVTGMVKLLMDKDASGKEKAGAVIGTVGGVTNTASSIAGTEQTVEGNNVLDATKEAANVLAEIAGIWSIVQAGYELVCQIVDLVKEADNLEDGEKASRSFGVIKAALEGGKSLAETILAFEKHLGTVTGPMLQAAPGIGIAMGCIDLIMQGLNIGYSYVAYSEMREDKRAAKATLQTALGITPSKTKWGGNTSVVGEAKRVMADAAQARKDAEDAQKEVDKLTNIPAPTGKTKAAAHAKALKAAQDKAKTTKTASDALVDKAEQSADYVLARNLQTIAGKRIKRSALNISATLPAIAGDIAMLTGAGAAVGAGLKAGGGLIKFLGAGIRMGKQLYHNVKKDEKSTANKLKAYEGMIEGMIAGVFKVNEMPGATKPDRTARLAAQQQMMSRIEASGMTKLVMNRFAPNEKDSDDKQKEKGAELYKRWIEALKKRD